MRLFRNLDEAGRYLSGGSALTIGGFDGIHLGHQRIISELKQRGKKNNLRTALVTFDPHPQQILAPQTAPKLLTTTEEKVRVLEGMGLEAVIMLRFDTELSKVSAVDFLQKYLLSGLSCRILVIGLNHAFGHRREGNLEFLKNNEDHSNYELVALDPVKEGGESINSSRIRRELSSGDFGQALTMLGHDFELSGKVTRGKGVGRRLGFPTINIEPALEKIIPPTGVYAAYSLIGSDRRHGMIYIGESREEPTIEMNLFDFDGDLYGKQVGMFPTEFIRPSMRFETERDLVRQIAKDEERIREMFNQYQSKE